MMRMQAHKQILDLMNLLQLPTGAKVLDAPCGTGRHSIELARWGMRVTGLDINKELLKIAKKESQKSKVKIQLTTGNLLQLGKYRGKFDLVANLFTSIGYFENDKKNEQALRQLYNAVKPGGFLVIETTHREFIDRVYQPSSWNESTEAIHAEVRKLHRKTHYIEGIQSFLDPKTGEVKAHYHRLRLYKASELKKIFKNFGASSVAVFGSLSGDKFLGAKSPRAILLIRK